MKYVLTVAALNDVRQITTHIRDVQASPQYARLVNRRLKKAFADLARMPTLGHMREEIVDPYVRVLHVSGVLVIYDPNLEPLAILRVVHGTRDLTRLRVR